MPYQKDNRPNDSSIRIRKATKDRMAYAIYNKNGLSKGDYTWDELINEIAEKIEQDKIQD